MPPFHFSRLLLVLVSVLALGCADQKKEDPAPVTPSPVVPPLPRLAGTWELTKQVVTDFKPDGTVASSTTTDTYVANGQIWRYVFRADGRFEYSYNGQTGRTGTYTYTATSLVQTNAPGYTPTTTFAIQRLADTELVLMVGSRTTTGRESVTTWAKR
ncbi:lipocalin family protein [Hymenobacter koreensis]|uniref:Lipocalin-like domain-containing protein n=1 Tax=Hymenobacter koreensis TaxID=1084523 RepID=A0ABP8JKX3_9BACT